MNVNTLFLHCIFYYITKLFTAVQKKLAKTKLL